MNRDIPSNLQMVVHTWHKQSVQDDIAFEAHLHIFPLKSWNKDRVFSTIFGKFFMFEIVWDEDFPVFTYWTATCSTDWNSHFVMAWKTIKFSTNITCFMIQINFTIGARKMIGMIWVTSKTKWFTIYYFHALYRFQKKFFQHFEV